VCGAAPSDRWGVGGGRGAPHLAQMRTRLPSGAAYITDSGSVAHYLSWGSVPLLHESWQEEDDGEYEWLTVPPSAIAEVAAAVAAGSIYVDGDEVTLGTTDRVWFTHRPRKSEREYESPVLEPELLSGGGGGGPPTSRRGGGEPPPT
jgi:hypothetical protein